MSTLVKRLAAGSALAAAAALVPAAPAAAAIICPAGYFCVDLAFGQRVALPEGQPHTFPAGSVMTALANRTKVSYCVGGTPNFLASPGETVTATQPIRRFAPGRHCLT